MVDYGYYWYINDVLMKPEKLQTNPHTWTYDFDFAIYYREQFLKMFIILMLYRFVVME